MCFPSYKLKILLYFATYTARQFTQIPPCRCSELLFRLDLKGIIGQLWLPVYSVVCFRVQVQTLAGSFRDTQTWSLSSFTLARCLVHSCPSCLRLCALCSTVPSKISFSLQSYLQSSSDHSPQAWCHHHAPQQGRCYPDVEWFLVFPRCSSWYYVIWSIIVLYMVSHLNDQTSSLTM